MHPKYTGITLVDGSLGSGKSYYATRRIEWALRQRRSVSTNVRLVDDWSERIANRMVLAGRHRDRRRQDVAAVLRRHYFYSDDILEVLYAENRKPIRENKGLMVVDEAHANLNSRTFAEAGRGELVQHVRQLRKLGWEAVLISQNIESVDKQLRDAITYRIHLVNWKRRYTWMPFNLFLAVHLFAADKMTGRGGNKPFARELYRLDPYIAGLYDTMALLGSELGRERRPGSPLLPFLDDPAAPPAPVPAGDEETGRRARPAA